MALTGELNGRPMANYRQRKFSESYQEFDHRDGIRGSRLNAHSVVPEQRSARVDGIGNNNLEDAPMELTSVAVIPDGE